MCPYKCLFTCSSEECGSESVKKKSWCKEIEEKFRSNNYGHTVLKMKIASEQSALFKIYISK